jgi:hypothetical protein
MNPAIRYLRSHNFLAGRAQNRKRSIGLANGGAGTGKLPAIGNGGKPAGLPLIIPAAFTAEVLSPYRKNARYLKSAIDGVRLSKQLDRTDFHAQLTLDEIRLARGAKFFFTSIAFSDRQGVKASGKVVLSYNSENIAGTDAKQRHGLAAGSPSSAWDSGQSRPRDGRYRFRRSPCYALSALP